MDRPLARISHTSCAHHCCSSATSDGRRPPAGRCFRGGVECTTGPRPPRAKKDDNVCHSLRLLTLNRFVNGRYKALSAGATPRGWILACQK